MKTLGVALLVGCLCAAGSAQTPRPQQTKPPTVDDTIRVSTTLVNTFFTVVDKTNKLIRNLSKEDFRVFEDDERQVVTGFSPETDLPLSVALVIDTSSSIRDKLNLEEEAAIDFLYTNIRRRQDRATVVVFDSGVDVIQDFTDDPEILAKAIHKIKVGGGTAMYDAVYRTISEKLSKESDQRRKALVLISDGADNSSDATFEETLELAQRHDIRIYCISTNQTMYFDSNTRNRDNKILKQFAEETGGTAAFPAKIADVSGYFRGIGDELRSQYSISYRPTKPNDGTFRRVRVEVVTNKSLKAKSRSGYYSPKPIAP